MAVMPLSLLGLQALATSVGWWGKVHGAGLPELWGYCPGGDSVTHSFASQPGLCSCSAFKVLLS